LGINIYSDVYMKVLTKDEYFYNESILISQNLQYHSV